MDVHPRRHEAGWSWQLAGWLAEYPTHGFPPDVLAQGARVFADTVAAIAAGMQQPEVRALVARLGMRAGPASVLASAARAEPDVAALLNGVAGTSVETDEGNYESGGHPAIHPVPAALAVAEVTDAPGDELLAAIILGYEASARIGRATRLRRAVHGHGTWGTIGAAVAAARMRRFDRRQMHEAIQIAASLPVATSRSSGLSGATVRNVYAGVGIRNGVLACDLAASGFTGEAGGVAIAFGQVLGERFDSSAISDDLGTDWLITRNFFKFAACCRETHGALDALEAAIAGNVGWPRDYDDIADITVATFADAAVLSERAPRSSLAARFSIPFALATRLVHGQAGVADFAESALADPRIGELARRITVVEDPVMSALVPRQRLTRLTIKLEGGMTLHSEVSGSAGDFDRPLPSGGLARKFADLTQGCWGRAGLSIYEDCLAVASCPSSRSLIGRMARTEPPG